MYGKVLELRIHNALSQVLRRFLWMNIPVEVVEVVVHEIPKSRWGISGKTAVEKFPNRE